MTEPRKGMIFGECGTAGCTNKARWIPTSDIPRAVQPFIYRCPECCERMDGFARDLPTQADVLAWVARRWPDRISPLWRAGKLCEEAGEVMGAVIKTDEGRKTPDDVAQETAQVVICAMALAESVGFDLWAEVAGEYGRCQP